MRNNLYVFLFRAFCSLTRPTGGAYKAAQAFRHFVYHHGGCDDWNEIELYGQSKEHWLRQYLELPSGIPSHDTFNRVFFAVGSGGAAAVFSGLGTGSRLS